LDEEARQLLGDSLSIRDYFTAIKGLLTEPDAKAYAGYATVGAFATKHIYSQTVSPRTRRRRLAKAFSGSAPQDIVAVVGEFRGGFNNGYFVGDLAPFIMTGNVRRSGPSI
jgi:hypothetical protein